MADFDTADAAGETGGDTDARLSGETADSGSDAVGGSEGGILGSGRPVTARTETLEETLGSAGTIAGQGGTSSGTRPSEVADGAPGGVSAGGGEGLVTDGRS